MMDWKPIADMPEELKDGDTYLLAGWWFEARWYVVGCRVLAAGQIIADDGSRVRGVTDYAEITPPESER